MIRKQSFSRMLLLTIMIITTGSVFASGLGYNTAHKVKLLSRASSNRTDIELMSEDFSEGLVNWEQHDGTSPYYWSEWWHTTSTGAYEGDSWWMGDEDIVGYENHRYLVLDTPDVTLPSQNPTLSFMLSYNLEPGSEYEDYDAWDGFNVRISDDEGLTWQVINGSPAYTSSSCYGFGNVFEEGTGVPGWTGDSDGWQQASFNLNSWAGQSIRIRFAFASDDNSCTTDEDGNSEWFGARIDNIDVAGVFTSNADGAEGDSQMVPAFNIDMSGDYWEAVTGYDGGLSAHCPIENNLVDELISASVSLPSGYNCYLSYRALWDLPDFDSDNDGMLDDYYAVYVKGVNEYSWTRIHYNYSDGSQPAWTLIDNNYAQSHFQANGGDCDLSVWAGETIQIKFQLNSDGDGNAENASGLFIDDVKVYYPVALPVPENLQSYNSGQTVQLLWDNPVGEAENGWLFWDDGDIDSYVGLDAPADFEVCARFFVEDLLPYVGGSITRIKFAPGEEDCDYWVRIWDGSGNILRDQQVMYPVIGGWNLTILQEPLEIEFGQVLWIGYRALTETGHPCGMDAGPFVDDRGAFIRIDGGEWASLPDASEPTIDANWNIEALVETGDGRALPTLSKRTSSSNRSLNGYEVYRRTVGGSYGDPIVTIDNADNTFYIDTNPPVNTPIEYAVTAIFDEGTSDYSIPVSSFMLAQTAIEYKHDDGNMESSIEPGSGEEIAVSFDMAEARQLKYLRIYLNEVGNLPLVIKLRYTDDATGMPSNEIDDFAVPADELTTGWNYIQFPGMPVLEEGSYCIGVMGTPQVCAIGEDTTDPTGYSFFMDGNSWEINDTGNYMLRVIADTQVANDDPAIVKPDFAFSNHPNPFNPETNFSFYLSQPEEVKLEVFNIRGQKVITLTDQHFDAGQHTINWNGKDHSGKAVSGGVYLSRLTTKSNSAMRKVLLLK